MELICCAVIKCVCVFVRWGRGKKGRVIITGEEGGGRERQKEGRSSVLSQRHDG